MSVFRDEPWSRRDDVPHDGLIGRKVPRNADGHLKPTAPQRGCERFELAAMTQQPLLAHARVWYPHRRDLPRVDLGIVVACEEIEVRAKSLGEPRGTAQDRLFLLRERIDDHEDGLRWARRGHDFLVPIPHMCGRLAELTPKRQFGMYLAGGPNSGYTYSHRSPLAGNLLREGEPR